MEISIRLNRRSPRDEILALLKRQGGMMAQEVAASLGVSVVAARRHLDDLEYRGLVQVQLLRHPVGRPAYLYVLTDRAEPLFPQGYRDLLLDLLAVLEAEGGRQRVAELLQACNTRRAPAYRARLAGKDSAEQLQELAQIRAEEGYMPSVAAEGELLVLREHHCPIRGVAERYSDACRCERELFEGSVGHTVHCRATIAQGAPACEFVISAEPLPVAETRY